MSKQIITNWEHYEPVASKDMAHMHHPAAGSLVDYVLRDAGGHIQTLLIGNLLDVEGFRSWQKADNMVKDFLPQFDAKSTALKGDGQKGEKKSHIATFDSVPLRPCSRHRLEELMRGGASADAKAMTHATYQKLMKCHSPGKVQAALDAMRKIPGWGERQVGCCRTNDSDLVVTRPTILT